VPQAFSIGFAATSGAIKPVALRIALAALLIVTASRGEVRTWTFAAEGKIETQDGATSFRKGGRLDAEFIRCKKEDGTNFVYLRLAIGGPGRVPEEMLSAEDRELISRFKQASSPSAGARENTSRDQDEANAQEKRKKANEAAKAAEAARNNVPLDEHKVDFKESLKHVLPLLDGRPADLIGQWECELRQKDCYPGGAWKRA
jgi:hypothetical protein